MASSWFFSVPMALDYSHGTVHARQRFNYLPRTRAIRSKYACAGLLRTYHVYKANKMFIKQMFINIKIDMPIQQVGLNLYFYHRNRIHSLSSLTQVYYLDRKFFLPTLTYRNSFNGYQIGYKWACRPQTCVDLSVCLRLRQFSQISFIQYMGPCVFSLPNSPAMIVRMCTLSYYHHQTGSMNH